MEIVAKQQARTFVWTIPNLLSFFRILSIPFVVILLHFSDPFTSFLAALIFSIAGITDLLDGYIARQQRSETIVGRLLDPMADKLLILSALIMLVSLGRVAAWIVVLIVAREVAVTGLRGIASAEGLIIPASRGGKAKTMLQSLALIGLLLHYEYLGINFHLLGTLLLWVALVVTVWSGVDYFNKFYRTHWKERTNPP
jgi:CDP-diacylglycerol--glycerol-3-phosphate 3-phosphatidyltransferase